MPGWRRAATHPQRQREEKIGHGAAPRRRSRQRTYSDVPRSMRTLRFLLGVRAGRLARSPAVKVLRLTSKPATETLYTKIAQRLAA